MGEDWEKMKMDRKGAELKIQVKDEVDSSRQISGYLDGNQTDNLLLFSC